MKPASAIIIYEGGEARVEVRLERDGEPVINDVGLAALAFREAESDARKKGAVIRRIEKMLAPPAHQGED